MIPGPWLSCYGLGFVRPDFGQDRWGVARSTTTVSFSFSLLNTHAYMSLFIRESLQGVFTQKKNKVLTKINIVAFYQNISFLFDSSLGLVIFDTNEIVSELKKIVCKLLNLVYRLHVFFMFSYFFSKQNFDHSESKLIDAVGVHPLQQIFQIELRF